MATRHNDDLLIGARHLAPHALFAGMAISFLGCCLAGYVASHHNPFAHVERFHLYLTPESLFYPTASQVRELARSELQREKIAVIIGGSSRLHGTGQPLHSVWTRRLTRYDERCEPDDRGCYRPGSDRRFDRASGRSAPGW